MSRGARQTVGPGFSLVEVLVAVLVLALGLLGLGAVFPVVLRQQRVSTETTLGLTAQNAARPILDSHADFRTGGRAWEAIRDYVENSEPTAGGWTAIEPVQNDATLLGAYELQHPDGGFVYMPLAQRLYPLPFTSEAEPRFVWDLAARLIEPDNQNSKLAVVLFLRPIDPGIRTGFNAQENNRRWTLSEVLIDDGVGGRDRRLPVSVDKDGVPTFDGRTNRGAQYGVPVVVDLSGAGIQGSPLDQCVVDVSYSATTTDEVARRLFSTVGQRFVDRRGDVYRVIRTGEGEIATISPALPDVDGSGDLTDADLDAANPVIFLPQVSAVEPYVFIVDP